MLDNQKYWKGYYKKNNNNLMLNSKLDRMRYYFNFAAVKKSINILKKNIDTLKKKEIIKLSNSKKIKKEILKYNNKNSNFQIINSSFIINTLNKYYSACGYKL